MRIRVDCTGRVQGVGFRPYLYGVAKRFSCTGLVYNHTGGVTFELQGSKQNIRLALEYFFSSLPSLARLDHHTLVELDELKNEQEFYIETSSNPDSSSTGVVPDLAMCDRCRTEFSDVSNRRYHYPFITCTECGPRYTVIEDTPYDRMRTSMKDFVLCEECHKEYHDFSDRRFHAESISCPNCSPQIKLFVKNFSDSQTTNDFKLETTDQEDALLKTVRLILDGKIIALKGLGGYHLVCDATNDRALRTLRKRKLRELKPFAVMVQDTGDAEAIAHLSEQEKKILASQASPILLLKKRNDFTQSYPSLSDEVAPKCNRIGVMLASHPLQEILINECRRPLVMTSGNVRDEPTLICDSKLFDSLGNVADAFLTHNRPIHVRCDDSVLTLRDGVTPVFYRRSRGYVPDSLDSKYRFSHTLLALGSHLKNCPAVACNGELIMSHHVGDLENEETLISMREAVSHLKKLYRTDPDIVVIDQHPDYANRELIHPLLTSKKHIVSVQHHHAHAASVMFEYNLHEPVIALALDGTGFGSDRTLWGGELLIADPSGFIRAAHLKTFHLVGKESAIREPWRVAYSLLYESVKYALTLQHESLHKVAMHRHLYEDYKSIRDIFSLFDDALGFDSLAESKRNLFLQCLEKKLNSIECSSCGRLFDAVSALLGVVTESKYEAHAAVELERLCQDDLVIEPSDDEYYPFDVELHKTTTAYPPPDDSIYPTALPAEVVRVLDWRRMILMMVNDIRLGVGASKISRRFHRSLAVAFRDEIINVSKRTGIRKIVFGGGSFYNEFLTSMLIHELEKLNLTVFISTIVPLGDGGIAAGQALIADSLMKEFPTCVLPFR